MYIHIPPQVLKHTAPLKTSTFWPGNYGFVPQTVAEDPQTFSRSVSIT